MHDYITNITLAKGSGEYCICQSHCLVLRIISYVFVTAHILAPGAHARMPLVDRISALKIPVAFVCTCLLLRALL
jgi:cardiolipin-specific phospholipase